MSSGRRCRTVSVRRTVSLRGSGRLDGAGALGRPTGLLDGGRATFGGGALRPATCRTSRGNWAATAATPSAPAPPSSTFVKGRWPLSPGPVVTPIVGCCATSWPATSMAESASPTSKITTWGRSRCTRDQATSIAVAVPTTSMALAASRALAYALRAVADRVITNT